MDQYSIRHYKERDEDEAAKLFNRRYAAYGGFVPRTPEYWLWSCLKRPDVNSDGVLFVSDNKNQRICGYAVVGTTGEIWEFCADGDEEIIPALLLKEIVRYVNSLGISSVNINVPHDRILCNVLAQEGFSKVPADNMFVSTLSLVNLLSTLSANKKLDGNDEINFIFDNVPFGVEKIISVKVHDHEVSVGQGSSESADVTVKMECASLLSILFGIANVHRELVRGKIRVKPFWKITKVTGFLDKIRLQNAWYWPLSDYG
jgi:hypothetical protein